MIVFITCGFAVLCILLAILTYLWMVLSMQHGKFWMYLVALLSWFLMIFTEVAAFASFEVMKGL